MKQEKHLERQKGETCIMTGNLSQDWPVYLLLGGVAFFFVYVIVKSNPQNRNNKGT